MSKQLEKLLKRDSRFRNYDDDRAYGDGWWLFTSPGFWVPTMETHFIHEDTVTAVLARIDEVQPCTCPCCIVHFIYQA